MESKNPEVFDYIESLEIPEEKKDWMKQYAANHIEYEKNPPQEIKKEDQPKKELVHFEIHDVMKDVWKNRTIT